MRYNFTLDGHLYLAKLHNNIIYLNAINIIVADTIKVIIGVRLLATFAGTSKSIIPMSQHTPIIDWLETTAERDLRGNSGNGKTLT